MERTVTVWGKPHAVAIKQASRTAFTAFGEFEGQMLIARGHSASNALAVWAASAKSRSSKRA